MRPYGFRYTWSLVGPRFWHHWWHWRTWRLTMFRSDVDGHRFGTWMLWLGPLTVTRYARFADD